MAPIVLNNFSTANMSNPVVYMDITIGSEPIGRLMFELFIKECPKTVENFRGLCTGEYRNEDGHILHYKGSSFHAVYPGWALVAGDIVNNNGTGGESIYGPFFEDESFAVQHTRPGLLSMMNFKNGTNNSQFVISLCPAPSMDNQNVVFGQIIGEQSGKVLDRIQSAGCDKLSGLTKAPVRIADCGQLPALPSSPDCEKQSVQAPSLSGTNCRVPTSA